MFASAAPPPPVVAAPPPIKLWGQAAQYMTPGEVLGLYPAATPATPAVLVDGAQARLSYTTTLSTGPAQVVFYFRGDELDAVLVHVLDVKPGEGGGLQTARGLRDTLARTYGPPTAQAEADDAGLRSLNAQWTRQPLKVSLGYQDVGGRRETLWVAFRAWDWNRHLPTPPRRFIKGSVRRG
ncbi:MAG: hypothetical protein INR64_03345 [Caulobacteraceae bacterium]|nr:hypothetical protein [Caulobacter sp.]